MSSASPDVVIYDIGGNALAVQNGVAIPASTSALMIAGSDGTNSRYININASGQLIITGSGSTGTPATGILTIQGNASGVAVPISGTVTANQGTANTLANAWSTKITDATNGPAAVKAASTAAVATDPALVVAVSPNNIVSSLSGDVTTTGALGVLNAAVQVVTAGLNTAGFQLAAGTLIGTILPEVSFDGGTTWTATYFDTPTGGKVSTIVFASSNTATAATIIGVGGSGLSRVRVSAYTSGTANITVRATTRHDPSVLYATQAGLVLPPVVAVVGGSDGTDARTLATNTSGNLLIAGTGTAGSAATAVVTVQGIASGTAVPIAGIIQPLYGSNNQAITCSFSSIANATARASTAISNASALFEDVLLFITIVTAATGTTATGYVNIYGYGSVNGGTNYSENITGSDAAITLVSPTNLALIAQVNAVAISTTYRAGPFSFCRMTGFDRLPQQWGVCILNETGGALAAGCSIIYQGVNGQFVA